MSKDSEYNFRGAPNPQKEWDDKVGLYEQHQGEQGDEKRQGIYDLTVEELLVGVGGLKGKTVLDAGSSYGYWTIKLKNMGAREVYAIDSSPTAIEHAQMRDNSENVHFSVADLTKSLPFKRNKFHVVVSNIVVDYIPTAGFSIMAKECYRVMRPGGSFILGIQHPTYHVAHHHQNELGLGGGDYTETTGYYDEGPIIKELMGIGKFTIYNKSIQSYMDLLQHAGFEFAHFVEPKPSQEIAKDHPLYAYLPRFALFHFKKPKAERFFLFRAKNKLLEQELSNFEDTAGKELEGLNKKVEEIKSMYESLTELRAAKENFSKSEPEIDMY